MNYFEKYSTEICAWGFVGFAVLFLIGGFAGCTWHFYTAVLCGISAWALFTTDKDDKNE